MTRHEGFTVFDPRDVDLFFDGLNKEKLTTLANLITACRKDAGKKELAAPIVVYSDNPVAEPVKTLLYNQINLERAGFYRAITKTHLLRIIESGQYGVNTAYFDGYLTEGTSEADYAHFTPGGAVFNPANNMVQALNLATQFNILVSAIPVEGPVTVKVNGDLESYTLPEGAEADYSTRLNTGVLLAVRRLLEAQYNVVFE